MRRVLAFYKFVPIAEPGALRETLESAGVALDLKGTILVAAEGINGTIVGHAERLREMQAGITEHVGAIDCKWSDLSPDNPGFYRFKVRLKPEIVSFGVPDLDVRRTGEHVSVERWHELLNDPDVLVIDTRNTYEVDIGTFAEAVSPQTNNFREFPAWVEANLDPAEQKEVAMFCTGGIRCEKASAYMLARGFDRVYQLDGGILRYLEEVEAPQSRWQGECFVFDQRVSVNADLEQGRYEQCFACRHPVSAEERDSPLFEQGVSCPHCHVEAEPADSRIAGLRERQRQVALAEARGERHIGARQGDS